MRCDGVELNVCCNNTKFLLLIVKLINFLLTFKVTNPIQGCYSSLYFCTQHNFVQCLVFRVQRTQIAPFFFCNHTWWYEILLSINCKYHHRATDCLLQCIYFQIFGGKCWELKLFAIYFGATAAACHQIEGVIVSNQVIFSVLRTTHRIFNIQLICQNIN